MRTNNGTPSEVSNSIVSVDTDLSQMRTSPKWRYHPVPSKVSGRAYGELVWLPVSESGVLIAIGGMANASSPASTTPQPAANSVCSLPFI